MKVRLEMPILIPAGLILTDTPRRTVRYAPFCEDNEIGIDSFEISDHTVATHPDRFTVLED